MFADHDTEISPLLVGLSAADLERLLAARPVSIFEEGLYRDALAHHTGTPVHHDHHPLSAASPATLFTEGTLLHRLLIVDGQVIDPGRTLRLASPNLCDAMVVRDRGCRFSHCHAPTAWVHAHHLQHWENKGPIDLANLTSPKYCPFAASMDQRRRGFVPEGDSNSAAADDARCHALVPGALTCNPDQVESGWPVPVPLGLTASVTTP